MQATQSPALTEHRLFFPLLRLLTNSTKALTTIHNDYGDIVLTRFFQQKILFVRKPEHLEQIFTQEAKGLLDRDGFYQTKKPLFGDGLVNSQGELWTKQRKLMQPFFTKEAVTTWFDLILEETNTAVERLKCQGQQEINISLEMKTLIQTIFIKIVFGKETTVENKQQLIDALATMTRALVIQFGTQLLGQNKLKKLFIIQNKQLADAIAQFKAFVLPELEHSSLQASPSLISQLAQAMDKKTGYAMTKALLEDEAINLFFAGQDTTVNVLIWFFYHIGLDETVHKKITEEINCHRYDEINPENLAKLSYTKAALYETLRLYPAASGLTRHPKECAVIGGHPIASDTIILLSLYATHQDHLLWAQPENFYPEHFLNPDTNANRHKYAFLPFGGGIHHCIGKHLAEQEMLIVIVSLLRAFTVTTNNTVKKAISVTLKPDRDVWVSIKPIG
jgi:enediyne biosynthesis protein E7